MDTSPSRLSTSGDRPDTDAHGRFKLVKNANSPTARNAEWMDREREKLQAYEYLCRIGEAKDWIEACTHDSIGDIEHLEEELRNGIALARLAKTFAPDVVKKIFEDTRKLQFRHSDNINYLYAAMRKVGLPEVFFFELTDLYEKKNIPKVIYCIHALAHLLYKQGLAPSIKDLVGKLQFTDEVLDQTQASLSAAGVPMPQFGNIANALAEELNEVSPAEKREKFLEEPATIQKIIKTQSVVRGWLARRQVEKLRQAHKAQQQWYKDHSKDIAKLQAMWKAKKAFKSYQDQKAHLKAIEPGVIKIQATFRGHMGRKEYINRLKFLKDQVGAIVKIQSMFRAKRAVRAYKSLEDTNPPVKTVQNFVHLLDDSNTDFEEEIELDKLRQLVVKRIRENLTTETQLTELDVKIALLVKNRISLDEVLKHTTKQKKRELENVAEATSHSEQGISLKSLDKDTRAKLENYQQLFYLLQTTPTYLANVMFLLNKKSGSTVTKFLENVVLTLYGYAQNTREEYLLLNLIKAAIKVEIEDLNEVSEFWRANPLFIKLVLHYTRGAKERQYLRELLQPLVKKILDDATLDLESDPTSIYKAIIRDEESRTGEASKRPYEVPPAQAAADEEVKKVQAAHTDKLIEITSVFMDAIMNQLKKMPFGIRYIAQQMKNSLKDKFPTTDGDEMIRIVGNLIYYRYMNPAIIAPEAFDVIESTISPIQRKNLAEVAKTLHTISVNKPPTASGDLDPNTIKLNEYIATAGKKFASFFAEAANVVSAEEQFGIDEFVDLSMTKRPVIYISPNEIFQVHATLVENLDFLAPKPDDQLRQILSDLGAVPPVREDAPVQCTEILLTLNNRMAKIEDEDASIKRLFMETKRHILAIVRIQSGKNLLELLEKPVTEVEEDLYRELLDANAKRLAEKAAIANRGSPISGDIQNSPSRDFTREGNLGSNWNLKNAAGDNVTFTELKRVTLENLGKLEAAKLVSRKTCFQDMLNSIAKDMLNKHKRTVQRKKDLQGLRQTLKNVEEKSTYLGDQKQAFMDYIDACMGKLTENKGKSKPKSKPMMFSRQWTHTRDLQKAGKMPQFGSFKYTAGELHKKGVLISVDEYSPKQYGQINLIISSDEVGVFTVEASFLGVKMPEKLELRLEDLLQQQYNGVNVMALFDYAKVNVNLLIYLLNKKFFV
ncbi:hypothetical protein SmJEL517_g02831 [Synchytrium microbalum]|uniref:Ras-GAP domain-containing protein n=1 Tax=Synchytrium microbalum TaxID=1806994 RepID=A0A507C0E3_9FUNG|nr:uncharacterized protein SmJEL517_g02831 [Synchytrium microbalum]TPX34547.1 hypothetical protein SmJEL517_g02831 [Synchytrium microbalum]